MVNKVILIGNVGMDPEVRTTESGVKVARVRLATTERLFDRQANETREHTEWHTITLWRGLADVVDRYVRKGSQIYIEGRLRTRDWMDKDNNRRYTTEILADSMNLLGRRGDSPVQEGASASYGQSAAPAAAQTGYASQAAAPARPAATPAAPQTPGYASQAAPAPAQPAAAPAMPAEDPDDLPF
ncbi:MAG: single-stranded DNA-binding protein [Alistipes sp.]|nr:single-stranded DNA-binding protein [Alistipes senegalensis]MCM1249871.1 single-stranded DNA-binding protein [Alistipes sp.]